VKYVIDSRSPLKSTRTNRARNCSRKLWPSRRVSSLARFTRDCGTNLGHAPICSGTTELEVFVGQWSQTPRDYGQTFEVQCPEHQVLHYEHNVGVILTIHRVCSLLAKWFNSTNSSNFPFIVKFDGDLELTEWLFTHGYERSAVVLMSITPTISEHVAKQWYLQSYDSVSPYLTR
jgi:hypothetical protein